MAYSRKELAELLEIRLETIHTLYQWDYVKSYDGDSGGLWTEAIARTLCAKQNFFKFLHMREGCAYHVADYDYQRWYRDLAYLGPDTGKELPPPNSEKRLAQWIYAKGDMGDLGACLNFELPLDVHHHSLNVDLASARGNELCLIELKGEESSETLLRAVLEIETYYLLADHRQMLDDFSREREQRKDCGRSQPGLEHLRPVVLIAEQTIPAKELDELPSRPGLNVLMEKLQEANGLEVYKYSLTGSQLEIRKAWPLK